MGVLDSIFGSSGIPSSPTSQRLETSSISPWAQPYVSGYLDRAQALMNQGPSAAQQQVYGAAQNMGTPGEFAQGSSLAQQGGQGLLGTTGTALGYGSQGAGYGQMATGAGQNYAQMATSPAAIQAYMNPYVQQSLAPQLNLLNQQQALAGQGIAAKAVGQGAFGGNRATLAQGLNAQNYDLARQMAVAQGYDTAFKQAQQAQQFGADLGLRGLATGIQGAQTGLQGVNTAQQGYQGATQAGAALGNIGAQQGQYGLGQLTLQNQIANQQYKLPFENLEFQRSMLSGLPVSSSSTQGFQAPPNYLSQGVGALSTGAGIYGMGKDAGWWGGSSPSNISDYMTNIGATSSGAFDPAMSTSEYLTNQYGLDIFAKGGEVKDYAKGGKVNYATGGDIKTMPTEQLIELLKNPNLTPMEIGLVQRQLALRDRMGDNPATSQIMGSGLDTIPSGDMFRAAGGGIVAFAEGDVVKSNSADDYLAQYTDKRGNVDLNRAALSLLGQAKPSAETDSAARQELLSNIKERGQDRPYELLTRFGLGALSGTSPYAFANLGAAGIDTMNAYAKDKAAEQSVRKELAKLDAEGAAKDDARRLQLAGTLLQIQGQKDIKAAAMANAPSAADRAVTRAASLINNDPVIKSLEKQQTASGYQPGSPEYDYYEQRIAERQNQIYSTVGVKVPEVGTSKISFPKPEEKPGFFDRMFGGDKKPANKVVPFSQLPS